MSERVRINDTGLTYEVAGDGRDLVWCHGLASCIDGDRDIIDAFAEAGFRVLAYDARGHGRSEPVRETERYSYPLLANDLLALMDHVGLKSAVLAGASMGAATAARVAAAWPERAAALVMARPGAADHQGVAAPEWLQMLFAAGAHAIRTGGLDGAIAFLHSVPMAREILESDPSREGSLKEEWGRHDLLSIAAALEGVPRTSPLAEGISTTAIVCPTLIVPGDDVVHPREAGERVAGSIVGARLAPPFNGLTRAAEVERFVGLVRAFVDEAGV